MESANSKVELSVAKPIMIKVPNSDVWIEENSVVAVARLADVVTTTSHAKPGQTATSISMVNFNIRLADGKAVVVQTPDRKAMSEFLANLGVEWNG